MNKSLNEQKPATINQITNTKPSVMKNANVLQGYIANSINGGMVKTIAYKKILAGEKIGEYRLRLNVKLLTPKTPAYQQLKATFTAVYVPDSRVWTNSEAFYSQKGGATVTKITAKPNLYNRQIPALLIDEDAETTIPLYWITETTLYRDSWISSYIPRCNQTGSYGENKGKLPSIDACLIRGFKAIYNDVIRHKEYDAEMFEYKGDTVTDAEYASYFPINANDKDLENTQFYFIRGKKQNSYYSDYRTELLGDTPTEPSETGAQQLVDMVAWEKSLAELRSQAENAQKNDWDIIAEIRGTRPVKDGKVRIIGKKTVPLNYSAVTQSTYNVNSDVTEEFQAMGTQGAYSYTEIDIPLFSMQEFVEEGYIHILMQVTADSVYETGFERTVTNVNDLDQYRPDLKELKNDVLYRYEDSGDCTTTNLNAIRGYKRKWSEYFKAPNCISGDMTTADFLEPTLQGNGGEKEYNMDNPIPIITQNTFQFFELTRAIYKANDVQGIQQSAPKNIWQDYTDLLINKNQAVMNDIAYYRVTAGTGLTGPNVTMVKGQNQIFFVGMQTIISDLPIDENIKNNFTRWGEK